MTSPEIKIILDKAASKLKTAKIDFESGQYEDSVSRAYYCVFHAISAALLAKSLVFSSHSQAIGAFNKTFIKTGIFPVEFSGIIQSLYEDRQTGDYDPEPGIDEAQAREDIQQAEMVLKEIQRFINS